MKKIFIVLILLGIFVYLFFKFKTPNASTVLNKEKIEPASIYANTNTIKSYLYHLKHYKHLSSYYSNVNLPQTLRDVELNSRIQEEISKFGEDAYEALEYRLGLLARLNNCIKNKIATTGEVQIVLFFDIDFQNETGKGNEFDFINSSLSSEETEIFLACLSKSHTGFQRDFTTWPGGLSERLYVGTAIKLPIENDIAYKILGY